MTDQHGALLHTDIYLLQVFGSNDNCFRSTFRTWLYGEATHFKWYLASKVYHVTCNTQFTKQFIDLHFFCTLSYFTVQFQCHYITKLFTSSFRFVIEQLCSWLHLVVKERRLTRLPQNWPQQPYLVHHPLARTFWHKLFGVHGDRNATIMICAIGLGPHVTREHQLSETLAKFQKMVGTPPLHRVV